MTARTRNSTDKILEKKRFLLGKLPTLKEIIGRCLTFRDYKTDGITKSLIEELHNLWITYNVYPISVNSIDKRLKL